MRDVLRLLTYLKRYKARISMAVAASFISAACLGAFILLIRPIAEEAFRTQGGNRPTVGYGIHLPLEGDGGGAEAPRGDQVLGPAAGTEGGAAPEGAGGEPSRHLPTPHPGSAAEPRAGGGSDASGGAGDREGAPASRSSGGASLATWQRRLKALRVRALEDLGFVRFAAYLHESPYTRVPLFVVFVFLLKGIFTYFAEYWLKWVGYRTIQDLRFALYEKILGQSARFFTVHPTGTLNSRVMGDVNRLQRITSTNLADAVRLSFTVFFMVIAVFWISWRLSLVCLVGMPLVLVPLVRFGRRLKSASRASQEQAAEVSNILMETIVGNRIVKAFGMEAFEKGRFRGALGRMFRADARALRTIALTSPSLELVGAILGGVLFWYAGLNISRGSLDGPGFFMFLAALGYMFVSMKSLSSMNNDLQQAMAAAARVFAMMDAPNEIEEPRDATELPPFRSEVRFDGVSFSYGDRTVLDRVDLVARAGEVHALVGSSGAGKSTLVNLIPRFYDVTAGSVSIDGIDVRRASLASIRRQIAMVTQEMVLFNDTVRNNIAYGNHAIPLESVIEAARAAGAKEFIEALPGGYDATIGEQGGRLSAGQRQRVTIARAFLKDSPVLILDEATSALDAESEALVQKALERLMTGRTSIVIAHRLSTIRRADCIHVLEGGRIVERGRHEELIARGGVYARLYAIQFEDEGTGAGKARERRAGGRSEGDGGIESPGAAAGEVLAEYFRSGGFAASRERIVVETTGRVIVTTNGTRREATLDPAAVADLVAAFDEAGFFGLRGEYLAEGNDLLTYEVTYQGRTVRAMDTAVPERMLPLLRILEETASLPRGG
jgi:subfamily B ATP-binding cassette protein MsbA